MRLSEFGRSIRLGGVTVHELQKVIELDSSASRPSHDDTSTSVSCEAIKPIERQMVIIVPCKNEPIHVIEGVLSGIPSGCLIVLVSNSDRDPEDLYEQEVQALRDFCATAHRPALAIHQRDPGVAAAFSAAGMPHIVDKVDGLVYNGKGEAMLMGMSLAALTGRRFVGFVDADNYVPGSVHEYCRVYAAGLHLATSCGSRLASEEAMVRISWASKPKLRDGKIRFDRRGRCSRITNEWFNKFLAYNVGYSSSAPGIIATGNAGEHAMTIGLGLKLRFARGYAVEPFQFVDMFERFGGNSDRRSGRISRTVSNGGGSQVRVLQIETRNPHFHDDKGEEHVQEMWTQALDVLYHSSLTPRSLRNAMGQFMVEHGALKPGQEPARERVYPPVGTLDFATLYQTLCEKAKTFQVVEN